MSGKIFLLTALFAVALSMVDAERAGAQVSSLAFEEILTAISDPSLANMRSAEKAWQQQDPATVDVLTKYAMALAFVSNHRDQPAFELIESLPLSVRKAGPLRRLWVWLVIKVRKDELAGVEIQSFLDDLKMRATAAPSEKDLDDLRFVAKVIAYLQHVAERDEPLAPPKARTWWQSFTAFPPAWQAELPTIEADLIAAHAKRKQELEDDFKPWKQKTDQELLLAQQKVAAVNLQVAAAKAQLTTAITAQQMFAAAAVPQLAALEASARQLLAQKASIPRPREPTKPRKDKDGKVDRNEEREYDREMDRYEREKDVYDGKVRTINVQLAALNTQATTLHQQEAVLQSNIRKCEVEHRKTETPLRLAEKNEQRLKLLLAERPRWDSPGSLATLRAFESYIAISLTKEVARIQAARSR